MSQTTNLIQQLSKDFYNTNKNKKSNHTYNPQASYHWIINQSSLPWLKLNIQIPYIDIIQEIENVKNYFVQHRNEYGNNKGWESFCIHGKSYDATRESNYYNDDRPCVWTKESIEHMPKTVNYFSSQWPANSFSRLRIMKLNPHSCIEIHKDNDKNILDPVNIAITQPDECNFVFENHGVVPFSVGDCFMLDVSNKHVVYNNSDQDRYHIIVHHKPNKFFEDIVTESYHRNFCD